ncbi:MAG TPA: thioredoxin domain-containing protein [Acidimicrobiales bacterium]|nr:thioredoxin domain-containing protein [Acidimicrobiales bacterium]
MAAGNRLADETSPYLRQHADNPVDWFPWGDEAFAEAKARDVPVLLSVGYSACHWCHVMAHESFEDEKIAAQLNDGFVSVKVDREERPDVDAVYMEAVQAVSGRGGWPMTVFLTPDGRPFYAGTYFPPADRHGMPGFGRLLEAVGEAWAGQRQEIEHQADALAEAVARRTALPDHLATPTGFAGADAGGDDAGAAAARRLDAAVTELSDRFDPQWGGFGPAPKFPPTGSIELCLRHRRLSGLDDAAAMARHTLQAMAAGGMYDHLGGGFCRYSTDTEWTIPHFEKMLYDQAALVRAYLHAWQADHRPEWLQVVEETIAYVLRDLRGPDGGLCSAEDADSEGEEGRFYLWTPAQIDDIVGPEAGEAVQAWYGMDGGPNFEGRSILRRPLHGALVRPDAIEHARGALFEARATRVRPGLDDKVLTEWNAMFCSALAEAAAATGRADWAEAAEAVGRFLLGHLRRPDGRWLRSWQGGRARHLAYAADHAWLVDCFTRLAELTGSPEWLGHAEAAALEMLRLFRPGVGPLFTTGEDAEALVVRPVELLDGATPSATAVAGAALVRLGSLLGEGQLADTGAGLLASLRQLADEHPLAMTSAVAGLELVELGVTEVVITGRRPDLLDVVRRRYEPAVVLSWGSPSASPLWEGRSDNLAYVCRDFVCAAPASTEDELNVRLDTELTWQRSSYRSGVGR